MSLRAATDYLKGLLNNQVYGSFPATIAYTEFMDPTKYGTNPVLVVWDGHGDEHRYTLGGIAKTKELTHRIQVFMIFAMQPAPQPLPAGDPVPAPLSFRDLIEGVMQTLRTSPQPTIVTDVFTGKQSTLTYVGEDMTWQYDIPEAIEKQGLEKFAALLTVRVREYLD